MQSACHSQEASLQGSKQMLINIRVVLGILAAAVRAVSKFSAVTLCLQQTAAIAVGRLEISCAGGTACRLAVHSSGMHCKQQDKRHYLPHSAGFRSLAHCPRHMPQLQEWWPCCCRGLCAGSHGCTCSSSKPVRTSAWRPGQCRITKPAQLVQEGTTKAMGV